MLGAPVSLFFLSLNFRNDIIIIVRCYGVNVRLSVCLPHRRCRLHAKWNKETGVCFGTTWTDLQRNRWTNQRDTLELWTGTQMSSEDKLNDSSLRLRWQIWNLSTTGLFSLISVINQWKTWQNDWCHAALMSLPLLLFMFRCVVWPTNTGYLPDDPGHQPKI